MGAAMKLKVMDWAKFTLDEWLKQYGAYISISRMKSGHEPDQLETNQIYWLVREANGIQSSKGQTVYLQMSEFEYEQVDKLIYSLRNSKSIQNGMRASIELYLHKFIRGMNLDQMDAEFCLSRSSINNMVYCGRAYILGHDKRLAI